jgi:hypothetical protein
MAWEDYKGQFNGCNPAEVGRAADARISELENALQFAMDWIDGLPSRPSLDDRASARRVLYGARHGRIGVNGS